MNSLLCFNSKCKNTVSITMSVITVSEHYHKSRNKFNIDNWEMPEKLQKPVFKMQINLKHEWNYAAAAAGKFYL